MFLIIPLAVFLVSLGLIIYMSARKFSYLKKISIDHASEIEQSVNGYRGFAEAMFPEVFCYVRGVNVAAHKSTFLLEVEKLLRKLRVWFLKMDNISNQLIHKVRTSNQEIQEAELEKEREDKLAEEVPAVVRISGGISPEELKKEEQRVIMEIAKNPKDAQLYKTLGNLYMRLEQFQDARESFVSALKLEPQMNGIQRKLDLLEKILGNDSRQTDAVKRE